MKKGRKIGLIVALCLVLGVVMAGCSQIVEVKFDGGNGQTITVKYESGDTLNDPGISKTGHTLDGWYDKEGNKWEVGKDKVKSDLSLTARWSVNSYPITYDYNGGEAGGTTPAAKADYGSKLTEPSAVMSGHTVKGWYFNGKAWNFGTDTVSGPTTLKAEWNADAVAVEIDPDNGGTVIKKDIGYGGYLSTPDVPVKDGYRFIGWYEGDDVYKFGTEVTKAVTIKAKWEKLRYTVTFDTGNDGQRLEVGVDYGEAIIEPYSPTRGGYRFDGWFKADGEEWNFTDTVASDMTLEAKFTKLNLIEYVVGPDDFGELYEGTLPGPEEVATGERFTAAEGVAREHYTFDGWSDGTTVYRPGDKINVTEDGDITLSAVFTGLNYTASFYDYNGEFIADKTMVYGSEFEVPEFTGVSRGSAYSFAGFGGIPEKMGENAEYTAVYTYEVSPDDCFNFSPILENGRIVGYYISLGDTAEEYPEKLVLPAEHNGKPVRGILEADNPDEAPFVTDEKITSAFIPAGYECIADYAFYGMEKLTAVEFELDCRVAYIGSQAFEGTNLAAFEVPASSTEIRSKAFYDVRSLKTLTFAEGSKLETIGASAFAVTSAKNTAESGVEGTVTFPASLKVIDDSAFSKCGRLTTPVFNEGLTRIGAYAFEGYGNSGTYAETSNGLGAITVPASVEEIGDEAFRYPGAKFKVEFVTENSKLLRIGSYAFAGKTVSDFPTDAAFTSLTLPSSLKILDDFAFAYIKSLKSCNLSELVGLKTLGNSAFFSCDLTGELRLPAGLETIGESAFAGKTNNRVANQHMTKVFIPSSVTLIGEDAFKDCVGLMEIEFEAGTEDLVIGDGAFHGYNTSSFMTFSKLNIPARCVSIGNNVFSYMNNLSEIIFEKGDKPLTIGEYAFSNYTSTSTVAKVYPTKLKEVTFNRPVTIGKGAFFGQNLLTAIKFNYPSVIGTYAFGACVGFTELNAASLNNVTSIESNAFAGVKTGVMGLTSVVIPSSVTYIGARVFDYNPSLGSLTFEDGDDSGAELELGGSAFATTADYEYAFNAVTLPSRLTTAGIAVFKGCVNLQEVVFPKDCRLTVLFSNDSTASGAFMNCRSLVKVTFGDDLEVLDSGTFSGCTDLETVVFGDKLQIIGESAFQNCSSLETVTVPGSVESIGKNAFYKCVNLTEVIFADPQLPIMPLTIGDKAFSGDTSAPMKLISFTFPARISFIGQNVFLNCPNIAEIHVAEGLGSARKYISDVQGAFVFSADGTSVVLRAPKTQITEFTAPDNVTAIGDTLFYNTKTLKTVNLPNVTSVGVSAFEGCTELTSFSAPKLEQIGDRAFYTCAGITAYDFTTVKTIGSEAFYGTHLTALDLSVSDVTEIGKKAFASCKSLLTVNLTGIQIIGESAFEGCSVLTEADLKGVVSLGKSAFSGATSLVTLKNYESIVFDDDTPSNSYHFNKCAFTSFVVPASWTKIPTYMFYNCAELSTVTFAEGSNLKSIEANVFSGCAKLSQISLPAQVTSIDTGAFFNTGLTSFTMPAGVTSIASKLFQGTPLASVNIPNGVTSIDSNAFYGTKLTSIDIPGSVTSIGSSAFYGTLLTAVTLPENLTVINSSLFYNVPLTSIIIPAKVTSIGASAFNGTKLTSVVIPVSVEKINGNAFQNVPDLKVYIENANTEDLVSLSGSLQFEATATLYFKNQTLIDLYAVAYQWKNFAGQMQIWPASV